MIQSKEYDQVIYQLFIDFLAGEIWIQENMKPGPPMGEGFVVALKEKKKSIEKRLRQ